MKKSGIIAYIAIIVIVIIIWYFSTHFQTNIFHMTTTSILSSNGVKTTVSTTSTSTVLVLYQCNSLGLYESKPNFTSTEECYWSGGKLGLWIAGGVTGSESVTIVGADSTVYVNQTSNYSCVTLFQNYTLPAEDYIMTLKTGRGGGSCGNAVAKLNSTTVPPKQVYDFVYNGDFHIGYAGWNTTNKGFGTGPINLTYADTHNCTIGGKPWANYNGTFFATTFDCGLTNSPGNLTSSPFVASSPFLDFKIISPGSLGLYIAIISNGTQQIVAHYNTFNVTYIVNNNVTSSYTFRNASIPLASVIGKTVQIKVVADTLSQQQFIAVTGFALSGKPLMDKGILVNMSFT